MCTYERKCKRQIVSVQCCQLSSIVEKSIFVCSTTTVSKKSVLRFVCYS